MRQKVALLIAALNFLLIGSFLPYDYVSAVKSHLPSFDGFYAVWSDHSGHQLNKTLLELEFLVVSINTAIGWLLLRRPLGGAGTPWGTRGQRIVLIGLATNLALAVLFPPMQYTASVSNAVIPSFDGFLFVLEHHTGQSILGGLLVFELIFIALNGAVLLLIFRPASAGEVAARRAQAMLQMRR